MMNEGKLPSGNFQRIQNRDEIRVINRKFSEFCGFCGKQKESLEKPSKHLNFEPL